MINSAGSTTSRRRREASNGSGDTALRGVSSFRADRNNERGRKAARIRPEELSGRISRAARQQDRRAQPARGSRVPGHPSGVVTRIVTSTYRYKRPPRKKTP